MRSWSIVALILAGAVCGNGTAAVWCVDADNTGTQNGTSWATAFNTIQGGVDAASTGDEVWVAAVEGTYTATDSPVVVMAEGVEIYGGFVGTETAREQRNWTEYETIIDGEDTRRCVIGADDATLDGFTITQGYGENGGGMYNDEVSPTVANCIFSDNMGGGDGGGAIYNDNASPTLTNCVFARNMTEDKLIPDEALEEAIRDAIEKPEGPLTFLDLEGVTFLVASDEGIESIEGDPVLHESNVSPPRRQRDHRSHALVWNRLAPTGCASMVEAGKQWTGRCMYVGLPDESDITRTKRQPDHRYRLSGATR